LKKSSQLRSGTSDANHCCSALCNLKYKTLSMSIHPACHVLSAWHETLATHYHRKVRRVHECYSRCIASISIWPKCNNGYCNCHAINHYNRDCL